MVIHSSASSNDFHFTFQCTLVAILRLLLSTGLPNCALPAHRVRLQHTLGPSDALHQFASEALSGKRRSPGVN